MDNKNQTPQKKPFSIFNILFMVFLVILLSRVISVTSAPKLQEVSMTKFHTIVTQNPADIETVVIEEGKATAYFLKKEGGKEERQITYFAYYLEPQVRSELIKELETLGVDVSMKPVSKVFSSLIYTLLPMLMLIAFWMLIFKRSGAGGGLLGITKNKAKVIDSSYSDKTFKDVAGIDEVKQEVEEIIDFLQNPKKFLAVKAKIPKGVLLMGPSGCGKTLLAKALAGEAGVPFFHMSGSGFVELFVGMGASRVRDLFDQAKKIAPCIVFIDELDAIGKHRGLGFSGGHDEREQTLNQLLVEMDGFETGKGIMMLAATNRPEILDPALIRPGRFDRRIVVHLPDVKGREAILKVHTRGMPLAKGVSLTEIAQSCPYYSGADLEGLVNEAAVLAARRGSKSIGMKDFYEAKDKQMLGVARKSMVLSNTLKERVAYHEAGHTLIALFTPEADPIEKVSIIPRDRALGVTWQQPIGDEKLLLMSKTDILTNIKVLLGGRVAEKLVYGEESTGAANDLERVTEFAEKMVCRWGMSDLGPLTFGKKEGSTFLGTDFNSGKDYSEETAQKIDEAKRSIIEQCEREVETLLSEHREDLESLTKALVKKETLDSKDLKALLKIKT